MTNWGKIRHYETKYIKIFKTIKSKELFNINNIIIIQNLETFSITIKLVEYNHKV